MMKAMCAKDEDKLFAIICRPLSDLISAWGLGTALDDNHSSMEIHIFWLPQMVFNVCNTQVTLYKRDHALRSPVLSSTTTPLLTFGCLGQLERSQVQSCVHIFTIITFILL